MIGRHFQLAEPAGSETPTFEHNNKDNDKSNFDSLDETVVPLTAGILATPTSQPWLPP